MATTSKNGTLYTTDGTDRVNWYPVTLAGNVQTTGGSDVETALSGKQATLTFDDAPTASSNNPVKSGGIKTAIDAKYTKPSGGIPATDLASGVQTSLGLADTALQSAPVTSVNTRTGAVTGLQEATTIVNKTSSDTSQTLAENTFYIWPTMSSLTITCPNTGGPYAFRFTSGSTATTLTMTGITMPDSWAVEANKVYEINVYQGYGVAASWAVSS